jgi:hypothetical protein
MVMLVGGAGINYQSASHTAAASHRIAAPNRKAIRLEIPIETPT